MSTISILRSGRALKLLVAAGAVGRFLSLPSLSFAQDASPSPDTLATTNGVPARGTTELTPMVVTGSMIPTVESITPSPVEVLHADVIEKVAATDITDLLRKTTTVFLGSDNIGQELNNGGFGESNVALRNLSTLVLLNGRRLANSAFSNGAAVDLNTIPVSMIERIEVLKDGASAIYGADAIGGVVNIILKKNYNGAEVGGQYGFTTRNDHYDQYTAYVTGGVSTDRTTITAGAQYYYNNPLFSKDRPVSSYGILQLAARGMNPPTYVSPSYPGRVDDYVLAGSPYAIGHPNYNPAIVNVPDQYLGQHLTIDQLAAAGVYIPLAETSQGRVLDANGVGFYPLINTSDFTYAVQRQDRRQVAATLEHNLIQDSLVLYGDFVFANNFSTGALAPSPAFSLGVNQVTIPADNPYNPFGVTLGAGGEGSPRVSSRFTNLGPRVFESDTSFYHIVAGLKGRVHEDWTWIEDLSWAAGFNYNLSDQTQKTLNAPAVPALNMAMTPDFDADPTGRLSLLKDASGAPLPTYDYFGLPGDPRNDPRTLNAIRATLYQNGKSELLDADFIANARAINLPAGKIGWAVGGLYRYESLSTTFDYLTKNGLALGLLGAGDFPGGNRKSWAGFIEANIPIISPDMNIPGITSLDVSAAGRFESLDPGGNTQIPKIGVKWQPWGRNLALRGTYSEGFIAPTLFDLFGAPQQNAPQVTLPDGFGQVQFTQFSDPNLKPATATTWTGGFVVTPENIRGLSVSFDYYRIDNPGISTYDFQSAANSLNALGSASPFSPGFTFGDGSKLTSTAPNQVTVDNWGNANILPTPGAAQRTDGIDLSVAYEWKTDSAGTFLFSSSANILLNYEYSASRGAPFYEYAGQYTDIFGIPGGQGTLPDWNLALSVTWDYRDFTFGIFSRYIPSVDDLGALHPSVGGTEHGNTVNGLKWHVDPWYTIDVQIGYEINRGKPINNWYDGFRFAVGCNNITDEDVPLIASSNEDNTDKQTYNILGRLVYLQVSKKF